MVERELSFAKSGETDYKNETEPSTELPNEKHDNDELDKDYSFYRLLVKNNIFKLLDSARKRRACLWLQKLDDETDKSLKCAYIKLMLVSLQHTEGNLSLFKHGPPVSLQFITNSTKSIKELIDSMLVIEKDAVEESSLMQTSSVSSDMTSYATLLATDTLLQAYYARSDYPIDTWNLPEKVDYPIGIRSASKWEKALSFMPAVHNYAMVDEDENDEVAAAVDEKESSRASAAKIEDEEDSKSQPSGETDPMKTEKECRKIMTDEQMVINEFHDFRWYEHSRLDGSLRPLNEFCIEGHPECYHDKTQLDLDEQAVNIVNKVLPGRVRLTLDPEIIYRTTETELKVTNPCKKPKFSDHDQTLNIDFSDSA
ncbi:uncharacterized protein LOC126844797 [Adelges cooleyi]|uniref:uncharacterized protein LOC126844797 n=1 Tax=Adelges cooleyi TaxID=133065 RepID=UPI00217F85FB|nr:uncharacterized protein LOC126844797 [Adelges cooleyi]